MPYDRQSYGFQTLAWPVEAKHQLIETIIYTSNLNGYAVFL
jgi:hypothetical protein